MSNPYYDHGTVPATGSSGSSASMRAEFDAIEAGFDKLPTLSGYGNKALVVNAGGTAITTTGALSLAGAFTTSGAYDLTFTLTAATTLTLPTTGTLATLAGTETLTSKTLNLASNTLTGTIAQFNAACSDADFATLAGTETLTNKTVNLASNTLVGTIAQFNAACSDADFLTLAGGNLSGGINATKTTVASAATPDIFAVTVGNTIDYTGAATCTGFAAAPQAGCQRVLVCAGAAVFTAGANLLIDGVASGDNFTAAAGDKILAVAVTTTQFRLSPMKADGTAVAATVYVKAQELRLTLTSGTPITTTDVTGATTIYLTPYCGNSIALYDGSQWRLYSTTEKSIAVPATTNTMYDVFVYSNAGTPTLELTAWANDTTRATALAYQDGVLVKSGATTRRYVGSFRTTGVSGQTENSGFTASQKRYLWNYYHRVTLPMKAADIVDFWIYTINTIRQANGNPANQLDFIIGVNEEPAEATVAALFNNASSAKAAVFIGLDSTTANSAQLYGGVRGDTGSTHTLQAHAHYRGYPGIGRHYLAWLESSTTTGTTTWYGDGGVGDQQSGIIGSIRG